MYKYKACEEFRPQYTDVYEDLNFEQQRSSWALLLKNYKKENPACFKQG